MPRTRVLAALAAGAAAGLALAGCSSGSSGSGSSHTIKVAYWQGSDTSLKTYLTGIADQVQKADPTTKVTLVPISGTSDDYATKLQLMSRTASTAPDVIYEDTFLVKSDAAAGYLAPIDDYTSKWADWSQFPTSVQQAGQAADGKYYGVSMGTDLRAIWYNKKIFAKAGVTVPWQPKTWNDILDAAKKIKATQPDVTPMNIFAGKAAGEASAIQGLEMLLSGTEGSLDGSFYDTTSNKWVLGSQGMTDALNFESQVYQGGLGLSAKVTSSANYQGSIPTQLLPQGKLAMDIDGSWLPTNWKTGGGAPWKDWNTTMGVAAMPTQNAQAPGQTAMSGGWLLSIGAKSKNKDQAWTYISTALNKANSAVAAENQGVFPARTDVTLDKSYVAANPTTSFFTDLVKDTHFRPATEDYPQVSGAIQQMTESVMTGDSTPEKAAQTYDDAVKGIVGDDKTETK